VEVATQFQECIARRGFQRRGRGRGNGARVERCERFSSNRSNGAWKFVLDVLGAKLLVINHVMSKVFVDDNSGLTLAGGNRSLNLLFVLPRSKHRQDGAHGLRATTGNGPVVVMLPTFGDENHCPF